MPNKLTALALIESNGMLAELCRVREELEQHLKPFKEYSDERGSFWWNQIYFFVDCIYALAEADKLC